MPDRTDIPLNYKRRMQAAGLLMSAAGKLIKTDSFSSINTATAVGDIYAAFEALGLQDYSDDEMTRNYRANTVSAADEIRENLLEVEA
jgi:hypothetical protein